jgi:hypothetical protein
VQVAIEYHISAAGRSRIDVLLAGSDGTRDNGLVLELKAWSDAEASPVPEMVVDPYGGRSLTQHPCVQARKYKGLILRFNADIAEKGVGSMLDGNEDFELIDTQNEAFQIIRHAIAVRLLAEVLGSKRLGFLVAPNKAFRDTLSEQLTKRHQEYRDDGKALFQSSWSFHQSDFMKDRTHEVLIGADLRFENGKVIGDPGKRARTDSSLKGWKKALAERQTLCGMAAGL